LKGGPSLQVGGKGITGGPGNMRRASFKRQQNTGKSVTNTERGPRGEASHIKIPAHEGPPLEKQNT